MLGQLDKLSVDQIALLEVIHLLELGIGSRVYGSCDLEHVNQGSGTYWLVYVVLVNSYIVFCRLSAILAKQLHENRVDREFDGAVTCEAVLHLIQLFELQFLLKSRKYHLNDLLRHLESVFC